MGLQRKPLINKNINKDKVGFQKRPPINKNKDKMKGSGHLAHPGAILFRLPVTHVRARCFGYDSFYAAFFCNIVLCAMGYIWVRRLTHPGTILFRLPVTHVCAHCFGYFLYSVIIETYFFSSRVSLLSRVWRIFFRIGHPMLHFFATLPHCEISAIYTAARAVHRNSLNQSAVSSA